MSTLIGITLVAIAGLGTGSVAWPMKLMRKLEFEHYWFVGMLVGLIIIPWAVVFAAVPEPLAAYGDVGLKPLILSNLFAVGWGIANVLYGICVVRIGAALTGAVLSGLGIVAGVTLPMIIKGTGLFENAPDLISKPGLMVLLGVVVILAGVIVCALAGFGRERMLKKADETGRKATGGFLGGLIMAIIAGVVSCGISLSFVYSQGPIIEAMEARGVGPIVAGISVWAAALFAGALVNILYPAYLMTRKKSWGMLTQCWGDVFLGAIIGIQFILAISLFLGNGMIQLGVLGASVGFGIQQAMQIMGNQGVGFVSGEWRGVTGKPRSQMYAAVAILIVAIAVLAYANQLSQ
ncbi:MAG TPA: hypothetical protein HPP83_05585 [Candidatus Hydrogenedentes bacterium]|nr:hypothetical protein [Candidatus Hydrogenedentota bacterium]